MRQEALTLPEVSSVQEELERLCVRAVQLAASGKRNPHALMRILKMYNDGLVGQARHAILGMRLKELGVALETLDDAARQFFLSLTEEDKFQLERQYERTLHCIFEDGEFLRRVSELEKTTKLVFRLVWRKPDEALPSLRPKGLPKPWRMAVDGELRVLHWEITPDEPASQQTSLV